MRQHIEPVAVRVDVLVRALEQAGAQSEVLGYTTGAWNGGRRAAGLAARRPRAGAEIYGAGVGLDLSPCYSRRQVLDLAGTVNMALFRDIFDMLARPGRR